MTKVRTMIKARIMVKVVHLLRIMVKVGHCSFQLRLSSAIRWESPCHDCHSCSWIQVEIRVPFFDVD